MPEGGTATTVVLHRHPSLHGGGVILHPDLLRRSNLIAPNKIASALSCLIMTERGRAFSRPKGSYSRPVGASS